jgi:HD-GYP domain-containing protein (c-di-GMP phosphodiesterase class II)
VAELAVAIAGERGFDADRVEGLKLCGMIHDIDKIYLPDEILNRPGKLTEHEFGIIKTHSDVSYHIIKDVKFPSLEDIAFGGIFNRTFRTPPDRFGAFSYSHPARHRARFLARYA